MKLDSNYLNNQLNLDNIGNNSIVIFKSELKWFARLSLAPIAGFIPLYLKEMSSL
jgi:hypothetical protein